jgi:hypothetical protein
MRAAYGARRGVVRPDGYIGMIAHPADNDAIAAGYATLSFTTGLANGTGRSGVGGVTAVSAQKGCWLASAGCGRVRVRVEAAWPKPCTANRRGRAC